VKPLPRSYHHRGGVEPLLGATIPEHFAGVVARWPDHEAVVARPQERRLTYAGFADEIDCVARGLVGLGFGKGDRIGLWSTNNLEWLLIQMATARVGAVLVNVNPAYRPRELAYALERSEIQGLFTIPSFRSSNYVSMLMDLIPDLEKAEPGRLECAALPHLRRVVVYDPARPSETARPAAGFTTWPDLLAAGAAVTTAALDALTATLDPDEPINIQYTSGTTGFPKAVELTHHNILNNAWFTAQAMRFSDADRLCIPVPFYHCFGTVLANLLCFSVGGCAVVACEHFDPEAVLEAIHSERCTAIHGVPTMFIAQLEHPRFAEFDLSSLRTGIMAGAPCPPALMKRVMGEMHCPEILIGYGETEASPLTHLTRPEDDLERRTETVGRNLPHQEVKVVEPSTRQALALGEVGEICFRGHHVMRGYYGDPEATQKAIDRNGWLASGDLVGRSRRHGCRGLPAHHRTAQGHDHSRRREHLPRGDRGGDLRSPEGGAGRRVRSPRRVLRRDRGRLDPAPRRGGGDRGGASLPGAPCPFQDSEHDPLRRGVSDDRDRKAPEVPHARDHDAGGDGLAAASWRSPG
jgi:fatty-acyl-CoA synthase